MVRESSHRYYKNDCVLRCKYEEGINFGKEQFYAPVNELQFTGILVCISKVFQKKYNSANAGDHVNQRELNRKYGKHRRVLDLIQIALELVHSAPAFPAAVATFVGRRGKRRQNDPFSSPAFVFNTPNDFFIMCSLTTNILTPPFSIHNKI